VKFAVVLTPGEDGFIVAECPTLPGCVTQGKEEDEAVRNAREAITGWLEAEADKVSKEAEAPVVLVDV
jgi:predicted RNase H-like HicB family nuclease